MLETNKAAEKLSLRIKAERLGTVSEVTTFLIDLEAAYDSIYAFDFLVDTLVSDRERDFRQIDKQFSEFRKHIDFPRQKDFPYDPNLFEHFLNVYSYGRPKGTLPNLIELQSKIDIKKIVLASDRLTISKVNIQSPGFWEVLGSVNPLQQIREYIKDRHERKKDNNYRSRQEEELGQLDIYERSDRIINQRINTLRSLGYSDLEIRQMVTAMVIQPLNRLDRYQDNGQIEGPDEH